MKSLIPDYAPEALQTLRDANRRNVLAYMKPAPRLTVSEWADRHRQLSREYAAEPGQWRTDRAPYQRGIMDAFSDPGVETVMVQSSSQVGKSEILMNLLGFFVDQDPSPIMVVQPTINEAEQWSKTRLAPTIRDTSRLRERIKDPRSRDSGNTLLVKEFPGGHITIVGANAPAGLAAKPIRILLCDEVDKFPASAGSEGDPITLAIRRTQTFWNRKIGIFSTPSLTGLSRIEKAFKEGDQRYYIVPCPACGYEQRLIWQKQLKYDDNRPETARYECISCKAQIPEREKPRMLARGHWEATGPMHNRVASFQINSLYSCWVKWPELVREWLEAQQDLTRLQVFVNALLGETWEDRGGGLDPAKLEDAKGPYDAEVPSGVGALTMGVDVQSDRIEYVVRGWGEGEESWRVDYDVILGDPAILPGQPNSPWDDLDRVRTREWKTPAGKPLKIFATGIDSGDNTDAVYAYGKPRYAQRVYVLKGSSTPHRPIVPRKPSVNNKGRVRLFEIGTEAAKDVIYARLRMTVPGPQYMHLPEKVEPEYLEQLTAEKVVRKQINGRWTRRYELPRGKRNEALDCEVYALAALRLAPVRTSDIGKMADQYRAVTAPALVVETSEDDGEPDASPIRPKPRSGWLNNWRP